MPRALNYYTDDDGCLVVRARLPAEEGAVVLQALNAALEASFSEQNGSEPEDVTEVTSGEENRFAQRRVDALVTMAEITLRHGLGPLSAAGRYRLVVQVTAVTLSEAGDVRCELETGDHW